MFFFFFVVRVEEFKFATLVSLLESLLLTVFLSFPSFFFSTFQSLFSVPSFSLSLSHSLDVLPYISSFFVSLFFFSFISSIPAIYYLSLFLFLVISFYHFLPFFLFSTDFHLHYSGSLSASNSFIY